MSSRPRLLYLAACPPAPVRSGVHMRTAEILRALQAVGETDCIVVAHEDQLTDDGLAPDAPVVKRRLALRPVEHRSVRDRLQSALGSRCISYHGHTIGAEDREFVRRELPNYDLVWLHHLRTANVLGQWRWPGSVMDLDDIPSLFYRSIRRQENGRLQQWAAAWRERVARNRERLLHERFDVFGVCSETDRAYLNLGERAHVIPNGFHPPAQEPSYRPVDPPRVGFIGAFDYAPNAEGVRWFAGQCWPRIQQALPAARLRLVGRAATNLAVPGGSGIDALGWLDDPSTEIASWSAMVVPVRMGAGTRIKVAEGFSRKCPVVSTALGVHGYEVVHGRELLLADTAPDFADACIRAVQQRTESTAMVERAWKLYLERWTWAAIQPRIWAAVEDGLRRKA